ncbi:hypothetical protein Dda_6347 [Drechslerella dactyloides]|uniref:Amidohydrolase 3 domain-containing protein n=1 Tax=Drechslerella dactyloides TaxID=74499 RepID=A0AAD6NHG1_DREDA|nr:hypothetical protein Dda_6347 [Drechslerella dactyloides]
MKLSDDRGGVLFAVLAYLAWKTYGFYTSLAAPIPYFGPPGNRTAVYCARERRVYTATEDEFTTVPARATCFQVADDGTFAEVWRRRKDVPEELASDVVELDGWVLPGLWDGHGHIVQYGMMESGVKAYNKGKAAIIDAILEHLQKCPSHGNGTRENWIQGNGWDQAYFDGEMPTADDLAVNPRLANLYIALFRVDVHCVWVSEAVIRLLSDPLPPSPPGGTIPTRGVFCDNAMDLIYQVMPEPTEDDVETYITTAIPELQKVGLVGVMDAATARREVPVYKRLAETGRLGLRVYGMAECGVRNTFCNEVQKEEVINRDGMFMLRAVKIFADGALGSWGAALLDPYNDSPTKGTMLVNETHLTKVTSEWYSENWQVNIHAIGDRANRAALDAFEKAMSLHPGASGDRRLRIEHAQIIHPSDQPRLQTLGIIPSIQPTHATSDMAYAVIRLGETRLRNSAYRMASLFPSPDAPAKLSPIFGSDFPVEPPSPLAGMHAAVTRCDPKDIIGDGCGRDPLWDDERVTRLQALRGFGRNVGYGGWLEGYGVGRIEKGGWADWVVVDKDVLDERVELRRSRAILWFFARPVSSRSVPPPVATPTPSPEQQLANCSSIPEPILVPFGDVPLAAEDSAPARPTAFGLQTRVGKQNMALYINPQEADLYVTIAKRDCKGIRNGAEIPAMCPLIRSFMPGYEVLSGGLFDPDQSGTVEMADDNADIYTIGSDSITIGNITLPNFTLRQWPKYKYYSDPNVTQVAVESALPDLQTLEIFNLEQCFDDGDQTPFFVLEAVGSRLKHLNLHMESIFMRPTHFCLAPDWSRHPSSSDPHTSCLIPTADSRLSRVPLPGILRHSSTLKSLWLGEGKPTPIYPYGGAMTSSAMLMDLLVDLQTVIGHMHLLKELALDFIAPGNVYLDLPWADLPRLKLLRLVARDERGSGSALAAPEAYPDIIWGIWKKRIGSVHGAKHYPRQLWVGLGKDIDHRSFLRGSGTAIELLSAKFLNSQLVSQEDDTTVAVTGVGYHVVNHVFPRSKILNWRGS